MQFFMKTNHTVLKDMLTYICKSSLYLHDIQHHFMPRHPFTEADIGNQLIRPKFDVEGKTIFDSNCQNCLINQHQ